MIYIIFIVISIASFVIQQSLTSKFQKYSRIPLSQPMYGKDVAERMLRENGINNVSVTSTPGSLTDHYNPANQTVNLSSSVYGTNSVAAAAVAAHECGHAVQHAQGYAPLKLRSALVPVVSFASQWVTWIILIGIILVQVFPVIFWIGIGLFAATTLFSFITLPVEIDASQRAIQWLERTGITQGENTTMAKSALRSAAYTYVIAALGSLATLVYYVVIAMSGRR
ncbi:MAG: zinc metallopeptidase [Muribaculaceae bacterium]|nr:zinc metallopeptidase [Muribaculaceae bacterium]